MQEESNTIFFNRENKYKIGKVTYVVSSHFDEEGEQLPDKMKRLLKSAIPQIIGQNPME